jgi:hypothetical protein
MLIMMALLPAALMVGCGNNSSPSNSGGSGNATMTTTPTVVSTIVPVGPTALSLGAASSSGPGGNFSVIVGASISGSPTLSGNVGGYGTESGVSGNGSYGASYGSLVSPGSFSSAPPSNNIYWSASGTGIHPDTSGYAIAASYAIFGTGGAYTTGVTETGTALTASELGGLSLTPGVYTYTGALTLGSGSFPTLTLNNAGGNPNNAYIFVTGPAKALTTYPGSSIKLINVLPANIFWVVQSSATLAGINSTSVPPTPGFYGTIMASTAITFDTGATLEGHAFCNTASLTFTGTGDTIIYP